MLVTAGAFAGANARPCLACLFLAFSAFDVLVVFGYAWRLDQLGRLRESALSDLKLRSRSCQEAPLTAPDVASPGLLDLLLQLITESCRHARRAGVNFAC